MFFTAVTTRGVRNKSGDQISLLLYLQNPCIPERNYTRNRITLSTRKWRQNQGVINIDQVRIMSSCVDRSHLKKLRLALRPPAFSGTKRADTPTHVPATLPTLFFHMPLIFLVNFGRWCGGVPRTGNRWGSPYVTGVTAKLQNLRRGLRQIGRTVAAEETIHASFML